MYARVNVWRGSIEETGLLLFDTRDEAISDISAEIKILEADGYLGQDLAVVVLAQIEESRADRHSTFICEIDDDPQTGRIVYFVLEAEHIQDRRRANQLITEVTHNQTGD